MRAVDTLREGEYALSGVFAPAGYAKSDIARSYAAGFARAASIDCATISNVPDLVARVARLFDPARAADAGEGLEKETASLARCWSAIDAPSLVALDNAESLGDAGLREALKALVIARPPQGRIFVASSCEPEFSLNDVFKSHVALTLRKADLAIDFEALRDMSPDTSVSALDLLRIVQMSGGWPFVALLLLRVAQQGRLERPFEFLEEGSWKDLFDWIETNVVGKLTPGELAAMLYYTACPDSTPDDATGPEPAVWTRLQRNLLVLDAGFVGEFRVPVILQCHFHARYGTRLREVAREAAEGFLAAGNRLRAARAHVSVGAYELAAAIVPTIEQLPATLADYAYPALVLETLCTVPPPYALYPALWLGLLPLRRFIVPTELLIGEADAMLEWLAPAEGGIQMLLSCVSLHATVGNLGAAHERLRELIACAGPEDVVFVDIAEFAIDIAASRTESALERWKRFGRLIVNNTTAYALTLRLASRAMKRTGESSQSREALRLLTTVAWRSRAPIVAAVASFEAAAQSWFIGDETAYRLHRRAFLDLMRVYDVPLLRAAAAIEQGIDETGDVPDETVATARARMIAVARDGNAASRGERVQRAVATADRTPSPWVRAFSRILAALCLPPRSAEFLAEAKAIAVAHQIAYLIDTVEALQAGRGVTGFLRPIIERLLGEPGDASAIAGNTLAIDFVRQTIWRGAATATLSLGSEALLVFLALHPGPVARETLIDELWPELEADSAGNALKVCVHRTRAQLGDASAIVAEKGSYRLGNGLADSQARSLREMAKLGAIAERHPGSMTPAERAELTATFEGLAARAHRWDRWFWFAPAAQALALAFRSVAELLARDALLMGDPRRAIDIAHAMSAESPFDELPVSILIQAFDTTNNRTLALAEYERFQRHLQRELGIEPSAELQAMVGAKKQLPVSNASRAS